ncbi:MAG: proline--tRNA ligase [Planctomycetes bacterium]|nr:proline--tRNA ligase [Planctomycetota bacterium]
MKMSQLVGRRDKNAPKEAQITSHQFLLRGGYARQVSAGLFSLLPLGLRVIQKIEAIVREEMNKVGGQEVLMPVVLPRELWDESGRYDSVGSELLRFKDRAGKDFVLGMTHEEAAVHLARSEIFSYKQLPATLYQIQTKFRDEPRSRGGLVRVREFTMKDAYSFHEKDECLEKTYQEVHEAYERIFQRAGLKNFISVASDAGMMGGGVSHEFMAVTEIGEDSFLVCDDCGYKANREVAKMKYPEYNDESAELTKVATPDTTSIEDVAKFLGVSEDQTCKAVFYTDSEGGLVTLLMRGDLEVCEAKVKAVLSLKDLQMADDELIKKYGMVPGYASATGTDPSKYTLILDDSLKGRKNLVAGANEDGFHKTGFDPARDLNEDDYQWADLTNVPDGSTCVECGSTLKLQRGVEIGNIFQLGKKYSESMNMTYLDQNGKAQIPTMGCYGIGIGRMMACIMEEHNDKFGPIWPESVAPYQVHINILDPKKENALGIGLELYEKCLKAGVEVLVDDRGEKTGFQFSDADLIGLPHRVIISPKNLKQGKVEYRTRASRDSELFDVDQAFESLMVKLGK